MTDTTDTTIPPQRRSVMSEGNVEDASGEMKEETTGAVAETPLEAVGSEQQRHGTAEGQGHCLPSQGVGGTERMDEGAQRADVSGAEGKRTGAMGGTETKPAVPAKATQGRREKHTNVPSSAGQPARSQVETGRSVEQVEKREEFPPLVASDGDECQPSQPLLARKKQRTDRQYVQKRTRNRSTPRRKSPGDTRRENLTQPM
jgi:hypothetical protein